MFGVGKQKDSVVKTLMVKMLLSPEEEAREASCLFQVLCGGGGDVYIRTCTGGG